MKKLLLLLILFSNTIFSNDIDFLKELETKRIDSEHLYNFDRLLIQDDGGRIKPINTMASEYIRKISRKSTLFGLSSTEIFLGLMSNPEFWQHAPIIKISHPEIKSILGVQEDRASHLDFLDSNRYKLESYVERAQSVVVSKRSKFQNEIIKVDERFNIVSGLLFTNYFGTTLRIFPVKADYNNTWDYIMRDKPDSLHHYNMVNSYLLLVYHSDWENSNVVLETFKKFQRNLGSEIIKDEKGKILKSNVIPEDYKIELEIWYNKLNIFSNLFMYYFLIGFTLLIMLFIQMFYKNKLISILVNVFKIFVVLGFFVHILGLISRWIISGHAPWSDGYESMIYIAFATMVSGLIFIRRSPLTFAATSLIASMILMVAHLNWLDPEITNLVPVLNSYWLMIHVSIITASYGFLACGALLGFIALWLMISKKIIKKTNQERLDLKIQEISIINEKSITIGLFMLVIGTFLGGIWANESWGRYWGWDPKETWALVSVLVYAFVLHVRFIPPLKGLYTFNFLSLISISSIIMTYFGVNYYLSGLHSYAAGDPMPIPSWIYYFIIIIFITAILSHPKLKFKK